MSPPLRRAVFSWSYDAEEHGPITTSLPAQLQLLFGRLRHAAAAAVSTKGLTTSFGWVGAEAFRQHDVNECFLHIFEFIKTECSGTALAMHARTAWEGVYIDYIHCRETDAVRFAGGVSVPFRSVQLQAEGMQSILDGFDCFVQPERFQIDNDVVGRRTASDKGVHFVSLPTHLFLQLKRFKFDWSTNRQVKVRDEVSFPDLLDLTAYLPSELDLLTAAAAAATEDLGEDDFVEKDLIEEGGGGAGAGAGAGADGSDATPESPPHSAESSASPRAASPAVRRAAAEVARSAGLPLLKENERAVWALTSIMVHVGGIGSGHYYAYARNGAHASKWASFNDATVLELDAATLSKDARGSKDAYCLLYERIAMDDDSGEEATARPAPGGEGEDEPAPARLRELVELENVAFNKRRAAWEHERRMFDLVVYRAAATVAAVDTTTMKTTTTKKKTKKKKKRTRTVGSGAPPAVPGMAKAIRIRIHDGETVRSLLGTIRDAFALRSDDAAPPLDFSCMRLRHFNTASAQLEAPLVSTHDAGEEDSNPDQTILRTLREAKRPLPALQPHARLFLEVRSDPSVVWEDWRPTLALAVITVANERGEGKEKGEEQGEGRTVYADPFKVRLRHTAPTVADLRAAVMQHFSKVSPAALPATAAAAAEEGCACSPWRLLLLRGTSEPLVLLDGQKLLDAPLSLPSGTILHAERAASSRYADVHTADAETSRIVQDYTTALNLATFAFNAEPLPALTTSPVAAASSSSQREAAAPPVRLTLHAVVQPPDVTKLPAMPMPPMPMPSSSSSSMVSGLPAMEMPPLPPMPALPTMPAMMDLPPMPVMLPAMGAPGGVPPAQSAVGVITMPTLDALPAVARPLSRVQIDVRRPMAELRESIARKLGLDGTSDFKLMRSSLGGEIKRSKESKAVGECGLRDGDRLWVRHGTPMRASESRWVVWLHEEDALVAGDAREDCGKRDDEAAAVVGRGDVHLVKLGDNVIVSKSGDPRALRAAIVARFGESCLPMTAALAACGGSHFCLRLREKSLTALTKVYCDSKPLASKRNAGKSLVDGKEVVVQLTRDAAAAQPFTEDSVLLRLQAWLPSARRLLPARELALPAATTVLELKTHLAAALPIAPPLHTGSSSAATPPPRPVDITFARPFPWQLRMKHALPGLAWGCHGRFKNASTLGKLNLENGTLLLFKDGSEAEDAGLVAEAVAAAAAEAAASAAGNSSRGGGAEVAFKIFTRAEQEARQQKEKEKEAKVKGAAKVASVAEAEAEAGPGAAQPAVGRANDSADVDPTLG